MNRFLWGGWVARPSAFFIFVRSHWFLAFGVGLVARVLLGLSFAVAVLNRSNWSHRLTVFSLVPFVYPCPSPVLPVLSMPSVPALLGSLLNTLTIYSSRLAYLFIR